MSAIEETPEDARKEYVWSDRRGHKFVSAQVVGETIAEIEAEKGSCEAVDLLNKARPEESPLHVLFEWDQDQAAESFRLLQAGRVIRTIRVVRVVDETIQRDVAFVSVTRSESPERGYIATQRALSDVSTRAHVIKDALRQLSAMRNRYRNLTELSEIWKAIDDAEEAA